MPQNTMESQILRYITISTSINACHSHSHSFPAKVECFFLITDMHLKKWMIPFEQGLETVSLLIYDLKRLCKYSLNTKQPAIMFLYWASIESLCWLFFYPAKQNKFLPEIQLCTGIVVINNRERFVCWRSMLFAQRATISFLQQLAFLPSV